jgi:hypothetical protein
MTGRSRTQTTRTGIVAASAFIAMTADSASAQDRPAPAAGEGVSMPFVQSIKISSCSVRTAEAALQSYDCSDEAAKICNRQSECEIQIGFNLTQGKDIDPNRGYLGKSVIIKYDCGDNTVRQRGPYYQSDHASVILECYIG